MLGCDTRTGSLPRNILFVVPQLRVGVLWPALGRAWVETNISWMNLEYLNGHFCVWAGGKHGDAYSVSALADCTFRGLHSHLELPRYCELAEEPLDVLTDLLVLCIFALGQVSRFHQTWRCLS